MAAGTLWRGTTAMVPGKEKWHYTATTVGVDVTFKGPYPDCLSTKPAFGLQLQGYTGMFVTSATATELGGGAGQLDITIEAQVDASGLTYEPLGPPFFELEFTDLSKPLESHSRCGFLNPTRGPNAVTGRPLTWEDWSLIDDSVYDHVGTGSGPLDGVDKWTSTEYRALRESGVDSYNLSAPVVRRTTTHLYPPPDMGVAASKLQFPPGSPFGIVSEWDWLGGSDRVTRNQRSFVRVTEWLGAEYWDRNLYILA